MSLNDLVPACVLGCIKHSTSPAGWRRWLSRSTLHCAASPQAVCAVWGTTIWERHQGDRVCPERRKIKNYLCSRFVYQPPQGHEVSFHCPWTTLHSFITTHMEEKQWVMLQGPLDQAKKFPTAVLKLDPREAEELPNRSVCLAGRTLCFPQKRVTYNYNPSFLPCRDDLDTEGRPVWPSQHLWCSWTTSSSSTSSPEWPSTSKASFLLYRGIEEGEGRQGGASPATCDM